MSNKLTGNFLAVNKDFFKLGLNPTEILILSQVDEFNRNTGDCYVSDETFAEMFGVSKSTISREMKVLESKGYIIRETKNVKGGKERHIKINKEATRVNLTVDSGEKAEVVATQTSNCLLTNVNLPIDNKQNDSIKENIKDKEKEKKEGMMNQPSQAQADCIIQADAPRGKVEAVHAVMEVSTAIDGSFKF